MEQKNAGTKPTGKAPEQAAVREPLPESRSGETARKKDSFWRDPNWVVALATVGTLIVSVYFSNRQIKLASRTIDSSIDTFQKEQRAWLGITTPKETPLSKPGNRLNQLVNVANTGRTPAKQVHGYLAVTVLNPWESPDFEHKSASVGIYAHVGALIPNFPQPFPLFAQTLLEGKATPIIITAGLNEDLDASRKYLVVYGRLDYQDIYGVPHWIQFCSQGGHHEHGTDIVGCGEYNQTDD